jgi:PAS domain S-box-containing protein
MEPRNGVPDGAVLDVFTDQTPLTADEVADAVGQTQDTVYERLCSLTQAGYLCTKCLGADTQVWWRSPSSIGQRSGAMPSDVVAPADRDGYTHATGRILETSPVGIVVVNPVGRIAFANERAAEILGLDDHEITDRTYRQSDWEIYTEDGTPISDEEHPVTRVLRTGNPVYGFEHWIRLSDGTERWLSSNSSPVWNDDGDIEYVVVGIEDATRLKQREERLTSEKLRTLELSSNRLFQPFVEAADGTFDIRIEEVVRHSSEEGLEYVTVTGLSADRVTEIFETQATTRDVRLLESTPERCRLERRVEGPTVPLIFDDLSGRLTSLVQKQVDREPVLVGEIPGNVTPRAAVQAVREVCPDIELRSQGLSYSPRLLSEVVKDTLTERQFEALQMAYYAGHFATPRASTGDELASRLGITRQTFHHHLRKAERAVFHQLFEKSPDPDSD